jgi:hypothetical protein
MSLRSFGVRYERLLILSAPLSFTCILLAFVAIASDFATDHEKALCYDNAANMIESQLPGLEKEWAKRKVVGKDMTARDYDMELHRIRFAVEPILCYRQLPELDLLRTDVKLGPSDLVKNFKANAERIRTEAEQRPIKSYGIEIPEKATISLMGTNIGVSIRTLVQILQLVLAPVLMLWLGALFNTRYRETRLIENATSIADLYPHSINIYWNVTMQTLRKRSRATVLILQMLLLVPALVRVSILALFILPPTAFYCVSLFYLASENHGVVSFFAGLLVGMFAFTNLASELNPWHSKKVFPTARCLDPTRRG